MTLSTAGATFTRSTDVHYQLLEGEAVLLDLKSGAYFGLDTVGTRIWELLDRDVPLSQITAALEEEFDAPREVLDRDTAAFVRTLEEKGLVSCQSATV